MTKNYLSKTDTDKLNVIVDRLFGSLVFHLTHMGLENVDKDMYKRNYEILLRRFCKEVKKKIDVEEGVIFTGIIKRLEFCKTDIDPLYFAAFFKQDEYGSDEIAKVYDEINASEIAVEIVTSWNELLKEDNEVDFVANLTVDDWNMVIDRQVESQEEIAFFYQSLSNEEKMILRDYCDK